MTIESAAPCSRSNWSVQIPKLRYPFGPLIGALLFFLPLAAWAKDVPAQIRVNQVGYEMGQSGRAYLMVGGRADGSKFTVMDAQGAASFSGTVGAAAGTWSKWNVYVLEFTIAKSGTYSIAVTGEFAVKSQLFKVDTPANLYTVALSNSLAFYQNQRDGADYIPSSLRSAPAHLNDQQATVHKTPEFGGREGSRIKGDLTPTGAVIDASGGWWDAGDCLKFVATHSTVVALMLIGIRDFPNQMGESSSASNFTHEAKFGLDWLQRMWDDNSRTLYYQVGIGSWNWHYENDHGVWRLPQDDDKYHDLDPRYRYIRNRPVFIAAPAGAKISPNLAGRLAGDFALCFMVYRAGNKGYADQCLMAAEHVFDLADTAPTGDLLTAAPHDFYPESDWRDDMEFGATELYLAVRVGDLPGGLPHTDPHFYLQAAANWAHAYIHSTEDTLNLTYTDHLAEFELWRAIGLAGNPDGLAVSQADLQNDMRVKLESAVAQAGKDPFGFDYLVDRGEYTFQAARISAMASEYDYMTNSKIFGGYSRQWLANLLGANAWGSAFIVGDGSTFPYCLHHQVANLVGSRDGGSPILAGAMVGGPNGRLESGAPRGVLPCPSNESDEFSKFDGNGKRYKDSVKFYSTVEPAIDYTSSSLLMFAWRAAGAPSNNILVVSDRKRVQ